MVKVLQVKQPLSLVNKDIEVKYFGVVGVLTDFSSKSRQVAVERLVLLVVLEMVVEEVVDESANCSVSVSFKSKVSSRNSW